MKTFRTILSMAAAASALAMAQAASAAVLPTALGAGVGAPTAAGTAIFQDFNSGAAYPGASYPGYAGGTVRSGSLTGLTADPPGTNGNFFSVEANPANGPGTLTLAANTFFGLYWGSIDTYNTLRFITNMGVVDYTGTDALNLISASTSGCGVAMSGNQTSDCTNRYIQFEFTAGQSYTQVQFLSTSNAFESDNHSIRVPEPGTLALFGAGLMGMWMAVRRRKNGELKSGFSAA